MRDATGQMYRRNRYYDPQSGQFTQPDPIGLAGGLNAYGFADGDPVSFSDPYGLCPPLPDCFDPTRTCLSREISLRWNAGDHIRLPVPREVTGTTVADIRFTRNSWVAYGVNRYQQDVVVFSGGAKADFPEGPKEDARWGAQLAGDLLTFEKAALNLDTGEFEASIRGPGVSVFVDANVSTGAAAIRTCVLAICKTTWHEAAENSQSKAPPQRDK